MPLVEPRDLATRIADSRRQLGADAADAWVASASADGVAHLVPLSLAWTGDRAVIAVDAASRTARNVAATGRARLGVGPTRDVVLIDAELERSVDVADDPELGAAYVAQADWDPRNSDGYVFLVLRPVRMQAWRESNEIPGRTIMRDGAWLAG